MVLDWKEHIYFGSHENFYGLIFAWKFNPMKIFICLIKF